MSEYRNRTIQSILKDNIRFESSGYVFRSLSWLDLSKRENYSAPVFLYAALDARLGIEQLLFEELVSSVGTKLDKKEYEKCLGNSTKLHAIINRLAPEREKLAKFNRAIFSTGSVRIPLVVWDHKLLMKYWGKISKYVHWAGAQNETVENVEWIKAGIELVEEAALYMWNNFKNYKTGVMLPEDMHPEIRSLWERYKSGSIGEENVKIAVNLLEPVLK